MPLIGIPLVFQTGGSQVQQQPQLVIAHMQVVDDLSFKFSDYFRHSFQFHPYLIFNQEVVIEIMFQLDSMEYKVYMLFFLICDVVLLQKNLKSILIDLFLEPTTHLTMQLHRNSKNSIAQFRI